MNEPKSDHRLSKFDWHDISPISFGHNEEYNLKEANQTTFASYSLIRTIEQIKF